MSKLKLPWYIATKRWGSVNLYLTRKCNLDCSYCGAIRHVENRKLTVDEWKRVIDMTAKTHFLFAFTGGEPLVYKHAPEVIEYASQYGLCDLQTNGHLLTDERLDRLNGLFRISISLDSLEEAGSPKYVHAGFSDMLERTAAMGRKKGYYVSVTSVVTKANMHKVPEVVRYLTERDIELDILLYHDGLTEENWQRHSDPALGFNTPESVRELEDLGKRLKDMKRQGFLIATLDSYLDGMHRYIQGEKAVTCRAGRDYMAIDTDGRVMACIDTAATSNNALEIDSLASIEKELVNSIPKGCHCWWECWQIYDHAREHPFQVAQERLNVSWRKWRNRRTPVVQPQTA
jgi:MoaA/NifB/PqqE/SkfB family radical SAM enzyme